MTTYVCRPSRNRYVSSAIFYRLTSEPPCRRCDDAFSSRRRGVTARARRRPFTGFLYYGPFGLSCLLTIHFVWTYMGTLEKLQSRSRSRPWDFRRHAALRRARRWTTWRTGVGIGGGNARFLGHNLSCFLVYIWARTYEGQEVAVMEFFTIRAASLLGVGRRRRSGPPSRSPSTSGRIEAGRRVDGVEPRSAVAQTR